ncbi:MAG TPA: sialidase family protein [Clostridia bacterium]|nr:sialidase family protein [Clostridia bacterium]
MEILQRYIAVDNKCLWPQLRMDENGKIFMTGFNQPCHGMVEGDVDCFTSTDGGKSFMPAGIPVVHDAGCNRMNHNSGFTHGGDFITIVSGYTNRPTVIYDYEYYKENYFDKSELVFPMVASSSDGGKTYSVRKLDYVFESESIIPFGEIIRLEAGVLAASIYVLGTNKASEFSKCTRRAGILISRDDGETWSDFHEIDAGINETSIIYCGNGKLLALARTAQRQRLKLYKSMDMGKSWTYQEDFSMQNQIPAAMTKLNDGRILAVYGSRLNQKSIMYRIGDEYGEDWSAPGVLVVLEETGDMGYPSSVQLNDGTLVTAYYADGIDQHTRYHCGIVRWNL